MGIVETECLKRCPKDAVVAVSAAEPQEWALIRAGTGIEAVARRLDLLG